MLGQSIKANLEAEQKYQKEEEVLECAKGHGIRTPRLQREKSLMEPSALMKSRQHYQLLRKWRKSIEAD